MSARRGSARYSLSDETQLMMRNKRPVVHSRKRTVWARPKKPASVLEWRSPSVTGVTAGGPVLYQPRPSSLFFGRSPRRIRLKTVSRRAMVDVIQHPHALCEEESRRQRYRYSA